MIRLKSKKTEVHFFRLPVLMFIMAWFLYPITSFSQGNNDTISSLQDPSMLLGDGYDAQHRLQRNRCVTGVIRYAGAQQSSIQMDRSLSHADFEVKMNTSGKISIDLGFIGGSVKAIAAATLSKKKYRETLVFHVEYSGKTAYLTDLKLTPLGSRLVDSGDRGAIKLNCGNRLLTSAKLGANLYIFVSFESNDKHTLQEFTAKFKVKFLGFKKTKTISKDNSKYSRTVNMRIDALQIGGNPEKLMSLKEETQNVCSIGDVTPCHTLIDKLYQYATGNEGIANQVRFDYRLQRKKNSVLSYSAINYDEVGLDVLSTDKPIYFDLLNKTSYRLLTQEKYSLESDHQRVQSILKTNHLLDERYKFIDMQFGLSSSLADVDRAIRECYLRPDRCHKIYKDLKPTIYHIEEEDLQVSYGFYQHCVLADENHYFWHVKNRVLTALGVKSCREAWDRRHDLAQIDLSHLEVDSVGFLKDFEQLTEVNISYNNIGQISALKHLKKLEKVNISHNHITSLLSITNSPHLRQINAAYNKVEHFRVSAGMPLRKLSLHGNPLKTLDLNSNQFSELYTDELQVCDHIVNQALDRGLIGQFQLQLWKESGFSPIFNDPFDPNSGVEGMYSCSFSAFYFDLEF